jgi:hypothetical protein
MEPFLRNEANFVLKSWQIMSNARFLHTEIGSGSRVPVLARASQPPSEDTRKAPNEPIPRAALNDFSLISETVWPSQGKGSHPFLAEVGLESPTYVISPTVVIQIPGRRRLFGNCRTEIAKNVK